MAIDNNNSNIRLNINKDGRISLDDAFAERLKKQREERDNAARMATAYNNPGQESKENPFTIAGVEKPVQGGTQKQGDVHVAAPDMQLAPMESDQERMNRIGRERDAQQDQTAASDNTKTVKPVEEVVTSEKPAGTGGGEIADVVRDVCNNQYEETDGARKSHDFITASKTAQLALDAATEKANDWAKENPMQISNPATPTGAASGLLNASRWNDEYYKNLTVDSVNQMVEQAFQNPELQKDILDNANRYGVDPMTYISQELAPHIQNQIYQKLVEKNAPQSSLEYVVSGVFNSTLGRIYEIMMYPKEQRQLREQGRAVAGENFGGGVQLLNEVVGLASDLPAFKVYGGIAGKMLGTLSRTNPSAARVLAEAANFGLYEGVNEEVGTIYNGTENGMDYLTNPLTGLAKGMVTGAAMGLYGRSLDKIEKSFVEKQGYMKPYELGDVYGKKVVIDPQQSLKWTANLAGKTGIFALNSVATQAIKDPNFDIDNVDWTDELKSALMLNLMLEAQGAVMRRPQNGLYEKNKLNDNNLQILRNAGIGVNTEAQAKRYMQLDPMERVQDILTNDKLDMDTKNKMLSMAGFVMNGNMSTEVKINRTLDGKFVVDELDGLGKMNKRSIFDSREEAERYKQMIEPQMRVNRQMSLHAADDARATAIAQKEAIDVVSINNGIDKGRLWSILLKGNRKDKNNPLTEEEQKLYNDITSYRDTYRKFASTLDEDVAEAVENSHGKDAGWYDDIRKKRYSEMSQEEREAVSEWMDEMQHRLQGGDRTQLSDNLDAKYDVLTTEDRIAAEQEGAELYAAGDMNACRLQKLRTDAAYNRMADAFGEQLSQMISERGVVVLEGYDVNEQQMKLVTEYLHEKAKTDAMVEALDDAHKVEFDVARKKVSDMMANNQNADGTENNVVRILNDGKGNTYVIRNQDGNLLMVTDVLTDEQGNILWDSYDENNAHAMQLKPTMAIGEIGEREVVEAMTPSYVAEDRIIFEGRDPEAGMKLTSVTDNGQKLVSTLIGKDAEGNWIVDTNGTQSLLDDATVRKMILDEDVTKVESEYNESMAQLAKLSEDAKDIMLEANPSDAERIGKRQWVADGKYKVTDSEGNEKVVNAKVEETIGKMMQDADGDTSMVVKVIRRKRENLMKQMDAAKMKLDESDDLNTTKQRQREYQGMLEDKLYWDQIEQMLTGRDVSRYGEAPQGASKPELQDKALVERFAKEIGADLLFADDYAKAYNEIVDKWNAEHPDEQPKEHLTEEEAKRVNGNYFGWSQQVLVNSDTIRGLQWAFGHESGHHLKNKGEYDRFKNIILKQLDQAWLEEEINNKRSGSRYKGLPVDEITDEIVNDQIGYIMNDAAKMKSLLKAMGVELPKESAMSTIKTLWDTTRSWLKDMNSNNWEELKTQAKSSGTDAYNNLMQRMNLTGMMVNNLTEAESVLAQAYKDIDKSAAPKSEGSMFSEDGDKYIELGKKGYYNGLKEGELNEDNIAYYLYGLNAESNFTQAIQKLFDKTNNDRSVGGAIVDKNGKIDTEAAKRYLKTINPELNELKQKLVNLHYSNVTTDAAKRLVDSEIYDINYAQNFYNMVADGKIASDELVRYELPRFSAETDEKRPVFYSNAQRAVEGIKQEKATPEQWKSMIQKLGGLKAGEDKWMGLSEWLSASDKKTLTKDELLQYIAENSVKVEEVRYGEYTTVPVTEEEQNQYDKLLAELKDEDAAEWKLSELNGAEYYVNPKDGKLAKLEKNDVNSVRRRYTTLGLNDNREIALTVPSVREYRGDLPEIHFTDEKTKGKAVAWARYGDYLQKGKKVKFEIRNEVEQSIYDALVEGSKKGWTEEDVLSDAMSHPDEYNSWNWTDEEIDYVAQHYTNQYYTDENQSSKVLFIDEIQSQRHQDGREKGYTQLNYKIKYTSEDRTSADIMLDGKKVGELTKNKSGEIFMRTKYDTKPVPVSSSKDAINRLNNLGVSKAVPDAPFDKNWPELAIKRMLRLAAEEGYDKLVWTDGVTQAARYNLGGSVYKFDVYEPDEYAKSYGEYMNIQVDPVVGEPFFINVDKDGKVLSAPDYGASIEGKLLSEVVGKEYAEKLMNSRYGSSVKAEDVTIGGDGMKAFYDKMLPSFVDKYCKKWGVKTYDMHLDGLSDRASGYKVKDGLNVHAIDVTPEMRESVMLGQPMFSEENENGNKNRNKIGNLFAEQEKMSKFAPEVQRWLQPEQRKASEMAHPNYKRKEIAFISDASRAGVKFTYDELLSIDEIAAAQAKVDANKKKHLRISDEEKYKHVSHLLDDEHGSFSGEVNGKETFNGEVEKGRKAMFVIGRPAGGKSSVYANPLSRDNKARIIDSDVVKPWLDGYDDGDGAGYVQKASASVADEALRVASDNGDNVVIPKIGGKTVLKQALELLEKGYDVSLYYNDVPAEVSFTRSMARFAEKGRFLDLKYLDSIDKKPMNPTSLFKMNNFTVYDAVLYLAKDEYEDNVEQKKNITYYQDLLKELENVRLRRTKERSRGEEEEEGRTLQGSISSDDRAARRAGLDPDKKLFSYSEWVDNDVPYGTEKRMVWNSNDGRDLNEVKFSEEADVKGYNFKRWFGDWEKDPDKASKVVDENGIPMVLSHGTPHYGFTTFDTRRNRAGEITMGSHFGSRDAAEDRLKSKRTGNKEGIYNVYLNIRNPWECTDWFDMNDPYIMTDLANLAIENRGNKRVQEYWNIIKRFESWAGKYTDEQLSNGDYSTDVTGLESYAEDDMGTLHNFVRAMVEAAGYDGIKYWNDAEGNGYSWIAFRPEQIKSAETEGMMANNGEFDPKNPDIRFSEEKDRKPEFLLPKKNENYLDYADRISKYRTAEKRIVDDGGYVNERQGDVFFSADTVLEGDEKEKAIKDLMQVTGRSRKVCERYVDQENTLAAIIKDGNNVAFLDYQADESVPSIWNNSDYPQGTVEFSNICRKRLPLTMIYQKLQQEYPNTVFDASTLETIRGVMKDNGRDVACALCFVEDRRQLLGEIANGFIDALKGKNTDINDNQRAAINKLNESGDKYTPDLYELLTLDGMKELRKKHPGVAEAFVSYNNARGMQAGRLFQAYSAYNRDILKYNKAKVKSINNNGGLRIFSFSDFEAHHLIDIVQVITDCAAKGIKIQGYTKVPAFAKAVKDTGMKVNRSLIPLDKGYIIDADGTMKLTYDTVEGIDINDPDFFDSIDNKNVGNILVGINDTQIRLAMMDPFVNYIIPFHTGLSKGILKQKGIQDWENYKYEQVEKVHDKKTGKLKNAPHHGVNIYTDVLNAAEEEGNPIKNEKQFVNYFLDVCKKKGYVPRFSRFLEKDSNGNYKYTPGYYKFLIDFKLFDKNGKILPQNPVEPIFDAEFNKKILDDYVQEQKEAYEDVEIYNLVKDRLKNDGKLKDDGIQFSKEDDVESILKKAGKGIEESWKQEYGSAGTSINSTKLPSGFALVEKIGGWKEGTVNLDMGGGRFDNATETLKEKGVESMVFDPYNRDSEHNKKVAERMRDEGADTTICNNCLNVINTEGARANVILQCAKALKPGGTSYFTVYEGNGSGEGKVTQKGESWQENRKTADYIDEISNYYDDVKLKGKLIIAKDPVVTDEKSYWNFNGMNDEGGIQFSEEKPDNINYVWRKGEDTAKSPRAFDVTWNNGKKDRTERDRKYGVGKRMGGVYFHKNYANDIVPADVLKKALEIVPSDYGYNCMYYDDKKPNELRFDQAPDFDTAREPKTGDMILVDTEKGIIVPDSRGNNIRHTDQIWHHKWNWVKDDYTGFDVQESFDWSVRWKSAFDQQPKGIGSKRVWDDVLRSVGLPVEGEGPEGPNGGVKFSKEDDILKEPAKYTDEEKKMWEDLDKAERTLKYTEKNYDLFLQKQQDRKRETLETIKELIENEQDPKQKENLQKFYNDTESKSEKTREEHLKMLSDAQEVYDRIKPLYDKRKKEWSDYYDAKFELQKREFDEAESKRKKTKPEYKEFTEEQNAENTNVLNAAKKEFGTTRDFREAGYILTDGTMLDFSEKRDGGASGQRTLDHRSIGRIEDAESGWDSVTAFMHRGNIRIVPESGIIDIGRKPSKEQMVTIGDFTRKMGGDVSLEFYDDNRNSEHYAEYEGVSPQRIKADVTRYFDEGIRPEGNISFSEEPGREKDGIPSVIGNKTVYLHPEEKEFVEIQSKSLPESSPWRSDFPKSIILTSKVQSRYPELYSKAKSGDEQAAQDLILELINSKSVLDKFKSITEQYPDAIVSYPHAQEASGKNKIPSAISGALNLLGLEVTDDIYQSNKPDRTNSDDIGRLFKRARFGGDVEKGRKYIIVDDQISSGATIRDMKDYIESQGGEVVQIVGMTASMGGHQISPTEAHLERLKELGITDKQLQDYGIARSINHLTDGEAAKLIRMVDRRGNSRTEEGSEGVIRENEGRTSKSVDRKRDYKARIAPKEGENYLDYAKRVAEFSKAQKSAGNDGVSFSEDKPIYDKDGNPIGDGSIHAKHRVFDFTDYPQIKSQVSKSPSTESVYVYYTNSDNGEIATVRYSLHGNNATKYGFEVDGNDPYAEEEVLYKLGLAKKEFIPDRRKFIGTRTVSNKDLAEGKYEEADLTIGKMYKLPVGTDISKYKGKLAKGSRYLILSDSVREFEEKFGRYVYYRKNKINEEVNQNIQFSAEDRNRSREWKQAMQDVQGNREAVELLRDRNERDIYEVAANMLGGTGLLWADEGEGQYRKKGVATMMHWGEGERRKFLGLFRTRENGGVTLSQAGEMVEQACRDAGVRYDQDDANSGLNAVMEVLQSANSMSDLKNYVEKKRIQEAYDMISSDNEREAEERNQYYLDNYGMTYDEYQNYMEQEADQNIVKVGDERDAQMVEWLKERNRRQAEQVAKIQAKLEEIRQQELGRPLVQAQQRIMQQQRDEINQTKTELNQAKDELRYKKNREEAYHGLIKAKSAIIQFIKEQIASETMPFISKQELNKLLTTIDNIKPILGGDNSETIKKFENSMVEVKAVSNKGMVRYLEYKLDRMMNLKIQGLNGKNMSVAKTVDDRTRRIFEGIRGHIGDMEITGLEEQKDQLYRQRREKRAEINELANKQKDASKAQKTALQKRIDEAEGEWKDLSMRIKEKEQAISQIRDDRARTRKIDVGTEIAELEQKFQDAAEGKAQWTEEDTDNMTVLKAVEVLQESKNNEADVHSLQKKIAEAVEKNQADREKMRNLDPNSNEYKKLKKQIEKSNEKIVNLRRLQAEALGAQVDSLQNGLSTLEDLMHEGRNNLRKQVDADIQHRFDILHDAFAEIRGGKSVDPTRAEKVEKNPSLIQKATTEPLYGFEYMCKMMGRHGFGTDGWFYQYFIKGKNGVMEAYNTQQKGLKEQMDMLNEKVGQIFGTKKGGVFGTDAWVKQAAKADKVYEQSGVSVVDEDGNRMEIPMSKGQAMYVYMVWKMDDGRTKLLLQGFDDTSVDEIKSFIGQDYIQLADWLQDSFLVNSRAKYNERYRELYHTSMARIENYVPLRIVETARRGEQSDMLGQTTQGVSNKTEEKAGSLINRTVNTLPVDYTQSAFDVISKHVQDQETWYAYSPVRRDLDEILGSRYFQNQLDANKPGSFRRFRQSAQIATQSDQQRQVGHTDEIFGQLNKLLVGQNIAWRFATSLKQLYSAPAYLGYAQNPEYIAHLIKNAAAGMIGKNWQWSRDNIPSFRKRVDTGDLGDYRLSEDNGEGRVAKELNRYLSMGMIPNRIVDGVTCSIGTKAIYDYNMSVAKRRLKALNLQGEDYQKALIEEERKAKMEADIFYNATQQSSHPSFLSDMQKSKSLLDRAFTAYQNSNIGYTRMMLDSLHDLYRSSKWKDTISYLEEKYRNDELVIKKATKDVGSNQQEDIDKRVADIAHEEAVKHAIRQTGGTATRAAVFGWLLKELWNLGSTGFFGFLNAEDNERKKEDEESEEDYKKRMQALTGKDIAGYLATPFQGMPLSNVILNFAQGREVNPVLFLNEVGDFMDNGGRAVDEYGLVSKEMFGMVLNETAKLGGVNLETLGNIYFGAEQMVKDGILSDSDDTKKMINLMYFLNTPKKGMANVARNLYKDEDLESYVKKVALARRYMTYGSVLGSWLPWIKPAEGDRFGKEFDKLAKEYDAIHQYDETNTLSNEFDYDRESERIVKEYERNQPANVDYEKVYRGMRKFEDMKDDRLVKDVKEVSDNYNKAMKILEERYELTKNPEDYNKLSDYEHRHSKDKNIKKLYDIYNYKLNELKSELVTDDVMNEFVMDKIRKLRDDFLLDMRRRRKEDKWDDVYDVYYDFQNYKEKKEREKKKAREAEMKARIKDEEQ